MIEGGGVIAGSGIASKTQPVVLMRGGREGYSRGILEITSTLNANNSRKYHF